jgi:hypothetical protein
MTTPSLPTTQTRGSPVTHASFISIRSLVKAEGCNSYRKRAEVISASKTPAQGVVMTSQQPCRLEVLQRGPTKTISWQRWPKPAPRG